MSTQQFAWLSYVHRAYKLRVILSDRTYDIQNIVKFPMAGYGGWYVPNILIIYIFIFSS
jgi:hypothetical protein